MDNDQYTNLNTYSARPKSNVGRFVLVLIGTFLCLSFLVFVVTYFAFISPPKNASYPMSLVVEQGDTLHDISITAESIQLIRSKTTFQTMMYLVGGDTRIQAGTYIFQNPVTVIDVALKVSRGDRDSTSLKFTIPEGYTREEIAQLFSSKLKKFNKQDFLEKTKNMEGYLFPETYFFFDDATADEVIDQLSSQFQKKTKNLNLNGKSLEEIIIMASIIEKEALGDDDRKIISGILWKRLSINMPLQVDATFKYILGKESRELTLDDLKIDSPYNTYTNRGLPPGPICNPGLKSIYAALEPTTSQYLYYLHANDGEPYYAKTFEEHKRNKTLFLK